MAKEAMQDDSPLCRNDKILTLIIERLFLTLMSRGLMTIDFFGGITAALVKQAKLHSIFLVVPPEHIKARIVQSLEHRNPGWVDFILSLGGIDQATSHFIKQQENMFSLNETISTYKHAIIEVDDIADLSDETLLENILRPIY
ncbi:hypothetical protein [Brenneria corticis]|uniref:Uncharacterized protein n=1 Tax=Brenneria corticis TaxID=2173106 RepID=A0A2U1TT88_9GAMM|nr:hypothetical protein [Brenneria sp. CFCC 11842]PWC12609.1 hypothetical protein DDT56_17135 [Brenneria sp. CFCC 11842]